MVLFGAPPAVPLIKGMVSAVWGMYIHANIDVKSGGLQHLINGPEAHRWHHSTDLAPPGMNFGTKLAIWDLLFGTFYLPRERKPTGYGLTYVDFPKGYVRQNLFAFRAFRRTTQSVEPASADGAANSG
jgi:sterol desaturase/sphingolipid hydroxylase (fatty acid hydroxylase superfamily)